MLEAYIGGYLAQWEPLRQHMAFPRIYEWIGQQLKVILWHEVDSHISKYSLAQRVVKVGTQTGEAVAAHVYEFDVLLQESREACTWLEQRLVQFGLAMEAVWQLKTRDSDGGPIYLAQFSMYGRDEAQAASGQASRMAQDFASLSFIRKSGWGEEFAEWQQAHL
jgi:hypothetical protein